MFGRLLGMVALPVYDDFKMANEEKKTVTEKKK
jgi:hypothetical protein